MVLAKKVVAAVALVVDLAYSVVGGRGRSDGEPRRRTGAPDGTTSYEADVLAPPTLVLGDTGTRSTVYAAAGDAVTALVSLGITPSA
jgi:hypothetical protein